MNGKPTVLVVEDEPDIRFTVALGLRLAGLEVREAATGEDAIADLQGGTVPDVVLLDLRLPGMDGMAVLRAIKTDERLRRIPVIVLSAHASQSTATAAYELGCDAYLTKPVSQEQLRAVVGQALARV